MPAQSWRSATRCSGVPYRAMAASIDECLNRELFGNPQEAHVILESWRVEYNDRRPHSSLGYQTPTGMPGERRTALMGATPPQTPGRSPRQPLGGNSGATPQG